MPALPPVPKVLRIACRFTDGSDLNTINRFYIAYSGAAPSAAQLATFNVAVGTNWAASMAPLYAVEKVLTEVASEDLTSPVSASDVQTVNHPGTRPGASLSAAACAVIQLGILRRYRGGHPRQYLDAGVVPDLATAQTWGGGFLAALQAAYVAWVNGINSNGWAGAGVLGAVNVSYFQGFTNFTFPSGRTRAIPKPRVGGPITDPIVSIGVNSHVGSQRRRNLQSA